MATAAEVAAASKDKSGTKPFPTPPDKGIPVGGAGEAARGLGKGRADYHPTDSDVKAIHNKVATGMGHPSNSKGTPSGY